MTTGQPDPLDDLDPQLLTRYLAGECSAAEAEHVARWVAADVRHTAAFVELRNAWNAVARLDDSTWDVERALHRVHQAWPSALSQSGPSIPLTSETRRPMVSMRAPPGSDLRRGVGWLVAATAAALLITVGLGITVASIRRSMGTADGTQPGRDYATSTGERATLRLRDGTRVVLAPASRLHVPDVYGVHARSVILTGEAFFAVVHDSSAPFSVHVGNTVVSDIGTSFDVTAYASDTTVRVAVQEGRISLRTIPSNPRSGSVASAGKGAVLTAGDLAAVSAMGATTITHVTDVGARTAWTTGRLEFRQMPARDAMRALSRWYDLDIELGDSSLAAVPFTASFGDEPIAEVLHIVAITLDAVVEHHGRSVVLVGRHPVLPPS